MHLHTWGELCLSPIGLSLVNKLAPLRFASLLMAVWFMANAAANVLAGKLSALYPPGPAEFKKAGEAGIDLPCHSEWENATATTEQISTLKELKCAIPVQFLLGYEIITCMIILCCSCDGGLQHPSYLFLLTWWLKRK